MARPSLGKGKDKTSIKTMWDEAYRYTMDRVRSYWLNSAYLEGEQWVYYSSLNNAINYTSLSPNVNFYEEEDGDRIRAVMNRIRSNQRVLHANMMQRELVFEALPTKADAVSIEAARTSEAFITYLVENYDWEIIREELSMALCKGGVAALSVEYDDTIKLPRICALSISEFVVQPGVRRAEEALWWIKNSMLPPLTAKNMYGLKELPPADAKTALSYSATLSHSGGEEPPLTQVLTYYERPNESNKKGRVAVEIAGNIVYDEPWPYNFTDRLNLHVGRETVIEGKWYGTTYLDDVRSAQSTYNSLWSAVLEHYRNLAAIKEFVPASLIESYASARSEAGVLVPWPDGQPMPQFQDVPALGNGIETALDRCTMFIDDIMAVHDVTRGLAPPNIESGLGIQILAEKDSSPAARIVKEITRMFTNVAQQCLNVYEHMPNAASVKVKVNLGFALDTLNIKPKNVMGEYDIRIPSDALIPRSRAGQLAFAQQALSSGLITDVSQYLMIAEYPGAKNLTAVLSPDIAKAQRELRMFVLGEPAIPLAIDDHNVHISVHESFMKSERYESLDEKKRTLVMQHWQAHKNMLAEAMADDTKMAGMQAAGAELAGLAPPSESPYTPPLPEQMPMEGEDMGEMMGQMPLPGMGDESMIPPYDASMVPPLAPDGNMVGAPISGPPIVPPDMPEFDDPNIPIEDIINALGA